MELSGQLHAPNPLSQGVHLQVFTGLEKVVAKGNIPTPTGN
jgi:hypothetical protein